MGKPIHRSVVRDHFIYSYKRKIYFLAFILFCICQISYGQFSISTSGGNAAGFGINSSLYSGFSNSSPDFDTGTPKIKNRTFLPIFVDFRSKTRFF
jgi:hypothetical protein